MKPQRDSDGAPTPRNRLNGSSKNATYANKGSNKPVSCTQAAEEATTNNESEPR